MLGSAAIVGISIGGSVLLFIVCSMSVVLYLRRRERKLLEEDDKRWGFDSSYHGDERTRSSEHVSGTSSFNSGASWSSYGSPKKVPNKEARSINSRCQPFFDETGSAAQTMPNPSNGHLPSMHWPLPSKNPITVGEFKSRALSPISENPVSSPANESTPAKRSTSAVYYSSKSHMQQDLRVPSTRKVDSGKAGKTVRPAPLSKLGTQGKSYSTDSIVGSKPTQALQRSKSESYNVLTEVDAAPRGTLNQTASVHGQLPGVAPSEPIPPLPHLLRHQGNAQSDKDDRDSEAGATSSPVSVSSAHTSILNLGKSPTKFRPDSDTLDGLPVSCSGSPSGTSEGPSMSDESLERSEQLCTNGLSSPSRKKQSGNSDATKCSDIPTSNEAEGQELGTRIGGQVIQHVSQVSLTTVGREGEEGKGVPSLKEAREEVPSRQPACQGALSAANACNEWRTSHPSGLLAKQADLAGGRSIGYKLGGDRDTFDSRTELLDQRLRAVSGNHYLPYQRCKAVQEESSTLENYNSTPRDTESKGLTPPCKLVSALKTSSGRKRGHQRRQCVRITNSSPIILGADSSEPLPHEKKPNKPRPRPKRCSSYMRPIDSRPMSRPLSRTTFDPLMSPTPQRASLRADYMGRDPSPPNRRSTCSLYQLPDGITSESAMLMLEHALERGSPGPSVFSSPISSLPRPPSFDPTLFLTSSDHATAPTWLQAASLVESSPSQHPATDLTLSPTRPRPLAISRTPRTPAPRLSLAPAAHDIAHSTTSFRQAVSETNKDGTHTVQALSPSTSPDKLVVFPSQLSRIEFAARNSSLFEMPHPTRNHLTGAGRAQIGLGLCLGVGDHDDKKSGLMGCDGHEVDDDDDDGFWRS